MKVLEYPTKSLKEPSTQVMELTDGILNIINDMREGMAKYPSAVGIAAPQVGHNRRIIIINTPALRRTMINPVIVRVSDDMSKSSEGCLSVPKVKGNVQRHWSVAVQYQTPDNWTPTTEVFTGFDSFVVQHELDHLDGVLFTDRLTGSDKKRANKKLNKRK